ncbi:MAG TPA: hypothetical protein VK550_12300 [Polyangiaceae bacterium]|nr:hypothetical protein [Polyangiaceae bacterium]
MAGNQKTRLNPYDSFKEWGTITVGGVLIPGIITSIDGHEKPELWIIQKGIEVSHAITVWRGTQLAESIKIVTNLYNRAEFDKYYDVATALRPKLGKKPPSLGIVNAAINFSGIMRVSVRLPGPPKPAAGLSWTAEIDLIEFNPPRLAKVGPADPPKTLTENDLLAKELAETVAQARKL